MSRPCVAALVLLPLAITVTAAAPQPASPLIVAHRGASHDAPENTLAAFKLAWEQGADAIEGDFHLTSDGKIVCIHDPDTERVAGVKQVVAKTALAELRLLDVGSKKDKAFAGERMPTLAEVLATVPAGKRVFLEVKCGPEILPAMKADLAASAVKPAQVTLISFKEAVILAAKRELLGVKACWLSSYKQDKATGAWSPPNEDILRTLRAIRADGLDTQAHERVDAALVKALRDAGMQFHCWTVDDPAVARRFAGLGVDSITTNRPAWLRERLRAGE